MESFALSETLKVSSASEGGEMGMTKLNERFVSLCRVPFC